MRRQGQYADSGVNAYVTAQMQHMSGQRMEHKSGHFQGRLEGLNSEKEHLYGTSKVDGQWRWERDGPKVSNPMPSHVFNEGQGGDAVSFYQGQRADAKLALEKQSNNDPRSQPHDEDMDIGYEDNPLSHTLEGIEKKFHDDFLKLAKEQADAEDAENARHRERINTINSQYEDQLGALRARHANRRDEYLRRESLSRKTQYQQAAIDHFSNSRVEEQQRRAYDTAAAAAAADRFDSYRDRARFLGGPRDHHGFEPRGQFPGSGGSSRVYDSGSSRYY